MMQGREQQYKRQVPERRSSIKHPSNTGKPKHKLKQAGSSAVEYSLVMALIVTLVVGVAGTMNSNLSTYFQDAVEQLSTFSQGGGAGDSPNGGRTGAPNANSATGTNGANPGVSTRQAEEVNDDGGGGVLGSIWGGVKQVGGVFKGIGEGVVDLGVGLGTLAYDGVRMSPGVSLILDQIDPEGQAAIRDKYAALAELIVTDPGAVLYAFVEPIVTDWENGNYGEAVGRGIFEVAGLVVTPTKAAKAGNLGRIAKIEKAIPDELVALDKALPDEVLDDIDRAIPDEVLDDAGKLCSFRGDMLVATAHGYVPIADVLIGDQVLSRSDASGDVTHQTVLAHYNNPYPETVFVDVLGPRGDAQTIVSNRIHPFYANGEWVQADELLSGSELVTEAGAVSTVADVRITTEPLNAFNLTVANYNTYFVKAPGAADATGIWVHNTCLDWEPAKPHNLWSKGKLKDHFIKHGDEVGAKTAQEYSQAAIDFAIKDNTGQFIDLKVDNFRYRYEPATGKIFVGTSKGKIKTFYKWDGRANDDVINLLKKAKPERFADESANAGKASVANAVDPTAELQRFRQKSNLTDGDTLAYVEVDGRRSFGVNSSAQPADALALRREFLQKIQTDLGKLEGKTLNRVRALTHAEAHSLMRAYVRNGGKLGTEVTIYVDRITCNFCSGQNGVTLLREVMGIEKVTIISPGRTVVLP